MPIHEVNALRVPAFPGSVMDEFSPTAADIEQSPHRSPGKKPNHSPIYGLLPFFSREIVLGIEKRDGI
jgi:hypothetical protein